ncbi:GNAT family N-acetyltransferase [Salinibacillus xinjiangensis]|uniref:GNAT family N-acetyltransferase n=1 Tax=Salinibacillus xinjiangensis TaxID=1229268 RepID=UPI002B26C535|nr:GNAT family N-acetyltransferase [Salinibacillus xinjiangensis]
MLFQNQKLKVRELDPKDKAHIAKWLSDPSVLEFYEGRDNPFDVDRVNEVFYDSEDENVRCMVEYDDHAIGYIQFYLLDDETKKEYEYTGENIYGTDQFIGEKEFRNKGLGTLLVQSMLEFLIKHRHAERIVMDPQLTNTRAIRCYEKCGFKRVKKLPNREYHEGEYRDCWLMEYTINRQLIE